jgi:hypothetical protein
MAKNIFSSQLISQLRQLLTKPEVKVDISFGSFTLGQKTFSPNITQKSYSRLYTALAKRFGLPRQSVFSLRRRGKITQTVTGGGQEDWSQEDQLHMTQFSQLPLKVSVTTSKSIPPVPGFVPAISVRVTRVSFLIRNFNLLVYLDKTERNYRVSMQLVSSAMTDISLAYNRLSDIPIDKLQIPILFILSTILGTERVYTFQQHKTVIHQLNASIDSNVEFPVDSDALAAVRSLTLDDLVTGGIVNNSQTVYTVSHKVKGERKLLYFSTSGVWLISPPMSTNLLFRDTPEPLIGLVLDGELVPLANRRQESPKVKYWYIASDCLSQPSAGTSLGDFTIQNKTHKERMEMAQLASNRYKGDTLLRVDTLTFRTIPDPNTFFARNMPWALGLSNELSFLVEGLLFYPNKTSYQTLAGTGGHLNKKSRSLVHTPEICVWKPPNILILVLKIERRKQELVLLAHQQEEDVEFKGTKEHPLTSSMIPSKHKLLKHISDGSIVEFRWDDGNEVLVPIRLLINRPLPMSSLEAQVIWLQMNNPISESTLLGQNTDFMEAYYKRQYQRFYQTASSQSVLLEYAPEVYNIPQWKKFSQVIVVEPQEEMRRRLQQRIKEERLTRSVIIMTTFKAPKDKPGVVVLNRRFSSLWRNASQAKRFMTSLVKTLSRGATMFTLLPDYRAAKEAFEPTFGNAPPLKSLRAKDIGNIRWQDPKLSIAGETVYTVPISQLVTYGFRTVSANVANQEPFMPLSNYVWSSMHSIITWRYNPTKINYKLPLPPDSISQPLTADSLYISKQEKMPTEPIEETEVNLLDPATMPTGSTVEETTAIVPAPEVRTLNPLKEVDAGAYQVIETSVGKLVRLSLPQSPFALLHAVLLAIWEPYLSLSQSARSTVVEELRNNIQLPLETLNPEQWANIASQLGIGIIGINLHNDVPVVQVRIETETPRPFIVVHGQLNKLDLIGRFDSSNPERVQVLFPPQEQLFSE